MKLKPLGNNVIVEPVAAPKESAGGIVMVGATKDAPRGRVLAVSEAAAELGVAVGDLVIYDPGVRAIDLGEGRMLLRATHIEAVLS